MRNSRSKTRLAKPIPAPPGDDASYEEIITYHSKYALDELERAGYAEEPPPEYIRELEASATYQYLRDYGLQVKLGRKDCERLAELTAKHHSSAETMVKRWIKERLQREVKPKKQKAREAS